MNCRRAGFDHFLAKPVRCEQLYECLRTAIGVEFRYADEDARREPAMQLEADGEVLAGVSAKLRNRLLSTAAGCRVTELRQCIDQLEEQAGPSNHRAAGFLRASLRRYDLDAIVRAVRQAESTETAAVG